MNLLPNEEQRQVIEAVSGVLDRQAPFQRLFGGAPGDFDYGPLLAESAESGWLALGLPGEAGGVGYSVVEEMLLARELGRNVAPLSLVATALAAHVAWLTGDRDLAAEFAQGRGRAGFAAVLGQGRALLVDADHVQYALMLHDGVKLAPVDAFQGRPVDCLDPTVTAVELTGSPADAIRREPRLLPRARLLIAAELAGLAERARDLGIEYAKTREQFGRPIGAFQAIKHRCSEMATRCEAAFAQLCAAASALYEGSPAGAEHAACAYLTADEAAIENARAAIQIHGAIGVTDEHALHVLVKRRHLLAQLGAGAGLIDDLLGAA